MKLSYSLILILILKSLIPPPYPLLRVCLCSYYPSNRWTKRRRWVDGRGTAAGIRRAPPSGTDGPNGAGGVGGPVGRRPVRVPRPPPLPDHPRCAGPVANDGGRVALLRGPPKQPESPGVREGVWGCDTPGRAPFGLVGRHAWNRRPQQQPF